MWRLIIVWQNDPENYDCEYTSKEDLMEDLLLFVSLNYKTMTIYHN